MIIEVTKKGTRDFYDEMLFIVSYYKKFIKNPNKKIYKMSHYFLGYFYVTCLMLCVFIGLYCYEPDLLYGIFAGMFALLTIFMIYYMIVINKRIKLYLEDHSLKTIVIENDFIEFKSEKLNLKMKKEDISLIVIGKYSICILPQTSELMAIAITKEYENEVLQGINECGYKDKIKH